MSVTKRIDSGSGDRDTPERVSLPGLLGDSPVMQEVFARIERYAQVPFPVLLQGETGTGKTVIARVIHLFSARKDKPFVTVSATIPETLLESELFGSVKGAFSGATDRKGKFEEANGGTILLEEIGEADLIVQKKLLRVLDSGEFERLGSNKTIKVDVKVVAASNRDLYEMTEEGTFRKDLYFRLKALSLEIPPLRTRGKDLSTLIDYYIQVEARAANKDIKGISPEAREVLLGYIFPGNVRELIGFLQYAVTMANSDVIELDSLPEELRQAATGAHLDDELTRRQRDEKESLLRCLRENGFHYGKTAEAWGCDPKTIGRLVEKYHIRIPDSGTKPTE